MTAKLLLCVLFDQRISATSRGTPDARLLPIELKQTTYSACVTYRARFDLTPSRADPNLLTNRAGHCLTS